MATDGCNLSDLPEPTGKGETVDGWASWVWKKGCRTLRIRHLERRAELVEFRSGEEDREVQGSLILCVSFAKHWFKEVGWDAN